MTYRVRGTVKDNDGKPVANATIRTEALVGFRGEQFAGQKEFETTTNAKGEWTVLGLTSGIWSFEATAPDLVPQVIVLPVNFTNRKPISGQGGSFPWDLPMIVQQAKHEGLRTASRAAISGPVDVAVSAIAVIAADPDPDVLCSAGEIALLVRQHGLARAIFDEAIKKDATRGCALRGLASSALMRNDFETASKMLWAAIERVPRDQRPALGAAVKDLQQISVPQQ